MLLYKNDTRFYAKCKYHAETGHLSISAILSWRTGDQHIKQMKVRGY